MSSAAKHGYSEIVQLLLLTRGSSFDLDRAGPRGHTPLIAAAIAGHTGIVKMLVRSGAKLDLRDTKYHRTALMWASAMHHGDIVRVLLHHGADPHVRGTRNPFAKVQHVHEPHIDALKIARHYGHHEAVGHLVDHIAATEHTVATDASHQQQLDHARHAHHQAIASTHDEL